MSKWSHLANAKHIDRIIAHVKANPKAWDAVQAERYPARDAAVWEADARVWDATSFAILALVAWDHAGGLMDLPAEQVKVLAILGDQAAIMMYSAIVAMETTQELA